MRDSTRLCETGISLLEVGPTLTIYSSIMYIFCTYKESLSTQCSFACCATIYFMAHPLLFVSFLCAFFETFVYSLHTRALLCLVQGILGHLWG